MQWSYDNTETSDVKKGVKTINIEFVWTRPLSQLSFVHFRPYVTSFPRLLFLTLISKSKKTLEPSLDLTPSFKTSVDARVDGLFLNFGAVIIFKRNMAEKDVCRAHSFGSQNCNFSFCKESLLRWWLRKVKRLSLSSLNSFNYFFIFWFKGLSLKTQLKTETWPLVNGGQLVLE